MTSGCCSDELSAAEAVCDEEGEEPAEEEDDEADDDETGEWRRDE